MQANYTFRVAVPDDVPAVRALVERAYRGPEAAIGWSSEASLLKGPRTSMAEIAGLFAAEGHRFVLAESGDGLAGCVLIEQRGDAGYFGMLSIDPRLQSKGLGKALLAEAERVARELWGVGAMTLVVINLRTPLIEWYGRRGYSLTGRTEPFPFDEASGEVHRNFHFIEMRKAF